MFPLRWNFPFRKKDGSLVNIGDAMGGDYSLPTASANTKGGIKVGSGLSMDGEKLNNSNPTPYSLPTASDEIKGGIKVGSGLSMDGESLNANPELPAHGVLEANKFLSVNSEGNLQWADGPQGTKIYYKEFSFAVTGACQLAKMDNGSAAASSFYIAMASQAYDGAKITVSGYTPVSAVAIDVYTGYSFGVNIEKMGNEYYATMILGNAAITNNNVKFRVYYVKNEDVVQLT